jgi:segregation and condensation protein B
VSVPLKQVIEALVFASPKPLQIPEILSALQSAGEKAEQEGQLRDYAQSTAEQILPLLEELRDELAQAGRGYMMVEQVNGWTLATNPDTAAWVRRLYPEAKPTRLSGPALETLAIIAYRQPVTRADLEAVRGVAVDGVMQVLLDRGLVKISGRAEVPGRPLLYSTTEFFLQHFGLKSVDELPNSSELKRIALPTAPSPTEPEPKEEKPKAKGKKAAAAEAAAAAATAEAAAEASATAAEPPRTTEPASQEAPATPDAGETIADPEAVPVAELDSAPQTEPSEPSAEVAEPPAEVNESTTLEAIAPTPAAPEPAVEPPAPEPPATETEPTSEDPPPHPAQASETE